MVEKGARRALDVSDVPLPLLKPELAMTATDDLALEAHGCRRRSVHGDGCMVLSLRVAANLDRLLAGGQGAGDWREGQGGAARPRIVEGRQAYGGEGFGG